MATKNTSHDADARPGSLAARVAQRRSALQARKTLVLDVPGYEGILAAEYRALSYEEIRKTGMAAEKAAKNEIQAELYVAAQQLIAACEDVYEVTEEGEKVTLGGKWGTALAERLGIDLPEGSNARAALFAIFPTDMAVILHYRDYSEWLAGQNVAVDKELIADFSATE